MDKRKRKYHDFSDDLINAAVDDIKRNKLALREAESKYNIPKSTLHRKINLQQTRQFGRPTVFLPEEENHISECIALAAKWGFPLTKSNIKDIVKKVLDSKGCNETRFIENRPGKKWMKCFLARQQDTLKTRLSHNIKRARAAVSPELIEEYFNELKESLKDVSPECIMNYDETSMQDNPGKIQVLVRRDCKRPEQIKDSTKSAYSVMFAGTASGHALPVYVVYKSPSNLYYSWMEAGPKDARYNRSKSGWFEGPLFDDWFLTIALPYFKKLGDGPKVIIGDNLASHLSVNVLDLCIKNNIKFILLPPNSTHLCQPLDLAYFSPLKTAWRKLLQEFKNKNRGPITKDLFPRKLRQVLDIIGPNSAKNLKAGFAASGICPLDPQQVLKRLPHKKSQTDPDAWTSSFEDFLKTSRQTETQSIRKRKKAPTVPGRSLSTSEVLQELKEKQKIKVTKRISELPKDNNQPGSSKPGPSVLSKKDSNKLKSKRNQNKTIYDFSDSSEDGSMSLHDTNSDVDPEDFSDLLYDGPVGEIQDECGEDNMNKMLSDKTDSDAEKTDNNTDKTENNTDETDNNTDKTDKNTDKTENTDKIENTEFDLRVNEFVVVKLTYNEGTKKETAKQFVAKIVKIIEDGQLLLLDFMRNYLGHQNDFIFPTVEDRLFVERSQIVKTIMPVSNIRNIFTFEL